MSQLNRDTGIHTLDQLGEKIANLQALREDLGKTGPFDIAIGPKARLQYGAAGGADRFLEEVRGLADVGVTWAMVEPPHPSRKAYLDHVQWFGDEVVAKLS
ncbi:MAG: hypothetical protein EOO83_00520 [Oxalobacteraceae bacterium]|nr:MAG: hypothetical protein EOO83_00520 [Oxalobacteraceae bacterium]